MKLSAKEYIWMSVRDGQRKTVTGSCRKLHNEWLYFTKY